MTDILALAMMRELAASERFLMDALELRGEGRAHMLDQAQASLDSALELHKAIHGEAGAEINLCVCPGQCTCTPPF